MHATQATIVRAAVEQDIPAIAAIYAHHVLNGIASFELEPPDAREMAGRHAQIKQLGLPYLVAEIGSCVAGYAYAAPYRARPAYAHTVEDSVYIDRGFSGRGVGSALMTALISECEAAGRRQMIAVIGDSANIASISLHGKFGFVRVGLLPAVGWKFGRWVDSVLMQRALGAGNGPVPGERR